MAVTVSRWRTLARHPFWEFLCIPALLIYHRYSYDLAGSLNARGSADYGPVLLTALDPQIPYVPIFVLPYVLTWGYAIFIYIYAIRFRTYDHLLFRHIYLSFLVMTAVETALWLSFPAKISIRIASEELALHGLLGDLTAYVYARATPWNVFPSAHIAFAYIGWVFSAHFAKREHRSLFVIIFILISLSVLFIKNHFLLDIAGGILLAELVYRVVFLPANKHQLLHKISAITMIGTCCAAAAITVLSYCLLAT